MKNKFKVIILGANSHIAKGLIYNLVCDDNFELYLYTTNKDKTKTFLKTLNIKANIFVKNYGQNFPKNADLIINCVGPGTPKSMNGHYEKWFFLLEKFDNLCLSYLEKSPKTLYVHFSSGAVYGTLKDAATKDSVNDFPVNDLNWQRFYGLSKLYAEGKHRALFAYNIVDLRVFSYFSRFINIHEDYFLPNIINAIKNNQVLEITQDDMVRDFISTKDLFKLILTCLKYSKKQILNLPLDVISKKPITKKQILNFFVKNYGLKYKVSKGLEIKNSGGVKNNYYSKYKEPFKKIGFTPSQTSLETLKIETARLLSKK
ncbi:MAG: NAD-dependent epimerase/dehydratase family protein [Elusimicrobiaceae bacterium]|nr:NAD-dependent epimerase/dehydratase family protein [Elusimicrobiaceae bacterium]